MRRFIALAVVLLAAALILPLRRVTANAAPPPAVNWFYIDSPHGSRVLGVQMWGCPDAGCSYPQLIRQWGECGAEECLPAEPVLAAGQAVMTPIDSRLDCALISAEMRCRSSAFEYGYPFFRLAVQFDDRLRTSPEPLPLPKSGAYGETHYWLVSVETSSLDLMETSKRSNTLPLPPAWAFFGISMAIELLVAGLYAALRWKLVFPEFVKRMVLIALINLLTYPVVWGFFPNLLHFSGPGSRTLGWALMAFTLVLGALLWAVFNASTQRIRAVSIAITVAVFFAGLFCLSLVAFSASYGNVYPTASGLPGWMVLLLAEIYAVVVEGLLLFGFTRRVVSLREALLLSLGMNAGSFFAGLLLAW